MIFFFKYQTSIDNALVSNFINILPTAININIIIPDNNELLRSPWYLKLSTFVPYSLKLFINSSPVQCLVRSPFFGPFFSDFRNV